MSRKNRKSRSCSYESLEGRELMAADITLGGNWLTIVGTDYRDQIVIREPQTGFIQAYILDADGKVRTDSGGDSLNKLFNKSDVGQIAVHALKGNDKVQNLTNIPSDIYGGADHDELFGGSADDYIYGDTGNDMIKGNDGEDDLWGGSGGDVIYGGNQNDKIYGGSGLDKLYGENHHDLIKGGSSTDYIYGGAGDDTLYGESGNDWLYGSSGRDNLYGGSNDDRLYGGSNNDGLFGGIGFDHLYGDSGADRILIDMAAVDPTYYNTAADAVISFVPTGPTTVSFSGTAGTGTFAAGAFNDGEIEKIDKVLADLHHKLDDATLLKTADKGQMSFHRHGAQTSGNPVGGWNGGGSQIHLLDNSFNSGDNWLAQTVFHEFGHNWDNENEDWSGWLALSGWTSVRPRFLGGFTQAPDTTQNWWYLTNSRFARDYGKTNPLEDFATSFAAYFMAETDRPYAGTQTETGTGGVANIPEKVAFLDDFFASLA